MSRDITVTFYDGSQHVYANAPDDISPDVVQKRAEAQFKKSVTHMDGGKASAAPAPEPETDTLAAVAANPLMRFALGAGSPVMGALEWLPGDAGRAVAESNKELERVIEQGKQQQSQPMRLASETGNIVGTIFSPMFLGLGKMMGPAKSVGQMFQQGAVTGAIGGATVPMGDADIGDKLQGVGMGLATGGAIAPVVGKTLQGIGRVVAPSFSSAAVDEGAARLANKAAGDRAQQVRQSLRLTTPTMTASQNAAPAGSSEFSALQRIVSGDKGTEFGDVARAQAAERIASLKGVTPDLDAAEKAVSAASRKNYAQAFMDTVKADPELARIASDPFFKKAQVEIADLIDSKGITWGNNPVGYLHNVKLGLDKMLARRGDTALASSEQQAVTKLKNRLTGWLEVKSPAYQFARTEHARLMEPVNQAKTLQAMAGKLENPVTGERPSAFMNTLGTGEQALLKKATGFPRFQEGDLQKVLTPDQYRVVSDIAAKLENNAVLTQREREGMVGALKAIRATNNKDVRAPSLISYKITLLNSMLNRLEGIGGEKVSSRLAELMLPGNTVKLRQLMEQQAARPQGLFGDLMRYQAAPSALVIDGLLSGEQQ